MTELQRAKSTQAIADLINHGLGNEEVVESLKGRDLHLAPADFIDIIRDLMANAEAIDEGIFKEEEIAEFLTWVKLQGLSCEDLDSEVEMFSVCGSRSVTEINNAGMKTQLYAIAEGLGDIETAKKMLRQTFCIKKDAVFNADDEGKCLYCGQCDVDGMCDEQLANGLQGES
jgi:hypothetical protein